MEYVLEIVLNKYCFQVEKQPNMMLVKRPWQQTKLILRRLLRNFARVLQILLLLLQNKRQELLIRVLLLDGAC